MKVQSSSHIIEYSLKVLLLYTPSKSKSNDISKSVFFQTSHHSNVHRVVKLIIFSFKFCLVTAGNQATKLATNFGLKTKNQFHDKQLLAKIRGAVKVVFAILISTFIALA